jgi:hypothetical protein
LAEVRDRPGFSALLHKGTVVLHQQLRGGVIGIQLGPRSHILGEEFNPSSVPCVILLALLGGKLSLRQLSLLGELLVELAVLNGANKGLVALVDPLIAEAKQLIANVTE